LARSTGRLSVLLLTLWFSTGHAGLCASVGLLTGAGTESAPVTTCPLHQPDHTKPAVGRGGGTAGMSCCTPSGNSEKASVALVVSPVVLEQPAEARSGVVLPPAALARFGPRPRDAAPSKSVPTHLLLSVFLV